MRFHFLPLLLFGIGASCKTLESENEIDIDSFDESDILDVVQNFIAEKDPILEVGIFVTLNIMASNFIFNIIAKIATIMHLCFSVVPEPLLPPP